MQLDRLLAACKQNICLNRHYSWGEKQDDLPSLVQFCCLWPQHWHPMSCEGKERERIVTSLLKYTSNTRETMATAKQCHPKRIKCRKSSFQGNVISHTTTMFSVEISRSRQALLYSFTLYSKLPSAPSFRDWKSCWQLRVFTRPKQNTAIKTMQMSRISPKQHRVYVHFHRAQYTSSCMTQALASWRFITSITSLTFYLLSSLTDEVSVPNNDERKDIEKFLSWQTPRSIATE